MRLRGQGFVQRGEAFVRLPVGVMQGKKGACETGSIGGCEAQIGQRRRVVGENWVSHSFAHIRHQSLTVCRGELRHIKAEFLSKTKHDRCGNGAFVVLHLIEIGQRDAELLGEVFLSEAKSGARFAQLGTCVEFLLRHGPLACFAG